MIINYPLYNLNNEDFEKLTALISERILGTGTIVFSKGKDGGRDGKFTGKANFFPSEADPWDGKFIIQAKHTTNPVATCSDTEFQRILSKELPKLRKLKEQGKIDFYIIFTNRKLSGLQDPKIEDFLDKGIGTAISIKKTSEILTLISNYPKKFEYDDRNQCLIYFGIMSNSERDLYLIGKKGKNEKEKETIKRLFSDSQKEILNCVIAEERIQLWLQEYSDIGKILGLNKLLMPLEFYEKDLQEIVIAFSGAKISKDELKGRQKNLERTPMKEKNRLNNLGKDYFDNVLKNSYSDFEIISGFLKDPINQQYKSMYDNTVRDLQEEIILRRNDYYFFEEILNHLYKLILDFTNDKLIKNRNLIRVFLHYMYFFCDIGKKDEKDA